MHNILSFQVFNSSILITFEIFKQKGHPHFIFSNSKRIVIFFSFFADDVAHWDYRQIKPGLIQRQAFNTGTHSVGFQ